MLNIKYIFILSFFISFNSFAEKGNSVVAKIFNDKRHFTFVKNHEFQKGDLVAVHDLKGKRLYEAQVKECKQKFCLAIISQNSISLNNSTQEYRVYYNKTQKVSKSQESSSRSFAAHYGTPIGSGLRLSYQQEIKPKLSVGASYSLVKSSDYSHVELSAHLLSAFASYHLFKFKEIDFNIIGEAGYAISTLDFSYETDELKVEDNVYVLSAAAEAVYQINNNWGAGLKAGASINGFESHYSWQLGTFSNPYGKMLVFFELGAYYTF